MDNQTGWERVFKTQSGSHIPEPLKIVLFLYLTLCKHGRDYGWGISENFKQNTKRKPSDNKVWDNDRGLKDLQYPNKIDGALKSMAESGLLIREPDSVGSLRVYYTINPVVLGYSDKDPNILRLLRILRRSFKNNGEVIAFINKTSKDSSKMLSTLRFIAHIFVNYPNDTFEEDLKKYLSTGEITDFLTSITTIKK